MPGTTRLDSYNDRPSTTAPGDGPADTTDVGEVASTVAPRPGPVAVAVGTVNAAVPVDEGRMRAGLAVSSAMAAPAAPDRFEEYDTTRPDGTAVRVRRNMDTGETEYR